MAIRNYVGARYVPKFADPIEWQANTSYEAMVIVTYNNSSYTSKIPVPASVGNPAENSSHWVLTGNYNAQVEEYREAATEAQKHARDGICTSNEGSNTTASKEHKYNEYFWWNGKLYKALKDIAIGTLLLTGSNVEEGNIAEGVYANYNDIVNIKSDVSGNKVNIQLISDNVTTNSNNIRKLEPKVTANTNNILELKTKTNSNTSNIDSIFAKDEEFENKINTNTTDISGLKTKDTELENKINTNTYELNNKLTRTIDVVGWNTEGHNFNIPNKNDAIIIFVGGGVDNAFSDIVTAVNSGTSIFYRHSNNANTIETNSNQIMVKNTSGIYMVGVIIR